MNTPASLWRLRFQRALVIAVLVAGPATSLSAGSMYTWVDERGTVHFSNSQVPRRHIAAAEQRANIVGPTPRARVHNASIPLISRDQKRFVKAHLEGRSGRRELVMLVDTGAQITMIDEATARELGAEFIEEAGIVGATGMTSGWIGQLRRVELGDKEVRDWRVMVGPVPGLLLLGMDVLERLELNVAKDYLEAR
jgi:predicted aspartyl protease